MDKKPQANTSCCCSSDHNETMENEYLNNECSCKEEGCCDSKESIPFKQRIVIDFLYLDLNVCERCQGTESILDEALNDIQDVLEVTGIEVVVNKINVVSEELAIFHKFVSSPTIRINGSDIQKHFKENVCESCGELCGDEVDCRIWTYQGKEYTSPPKAMIIEAILKNAYGNEEIQETEYSLPENLKQFFQAMKIKNNKPCCN